MPIYKKFSQNCTKSKEISARGINLPTVKQVDFNLVCKLIEECMSQKK